MREHYAYNNSREYDRKLGQRIGSDAKCVAIDGYMIKAKKVRQWMTMTGIAAVFGTYSWRLDFTLLPVVMRSEE